MLLRRFLVLLTLLFWLGGSLFYAAVVIPVGLSTLDPREQQFFVTQAVTNYLNLACAAALAVWAWDLWSGGGPAGPVGRGRSFLWLLIGLCLGVLFLLHTWIDGFMDKRTVSIRDADRLRPLHLTYAAVNALQCLAGIAFALLTLVSWGGQDRERRA
jgi:hypothetical protein